MTASGADVIAFVKAYAAVISENRGYLVELDAAIGDADHGENMDRGMKAAVAAIEQLPSEASPAAVVKAFAMALVSKVGGAAGPLYGTAMLRAAPVLGDQPRTSDVVAALAAAQAGIADRGHAELGDKTMLDAWGPAVTAAQKALEQGRPPSEVFASAASAAEQGMHETIPLVARKGRASYLGARSAGHQDPGATSTWLLFRVLAEQTADR